MFLFLIKSQSPHVLLVSHIFSSLDSECLCLFTKGEGLCLRACWFLFHPLFRQGGKGFCVSPAKNLIQQALPLERFVFHLALPKGICVSFISDLFLYFLKTNTLALLCWQAFLSFKPNLQSYITKYF